MKYFSKVWLLTGIVSPIIIILINEKFSFSLSLIPGWIFTIVVGLLLSLPSLLILYVISQNIETKIDYRIIFTILSFFLIFITFILVGFELTMNMEELYMPSIYFIVMSVGIWIFSSEKENVA